MADVEKLTLEQLSGIIDNTTGTPTIVNEKSNFVVVTYWWGRGNLNANTARPCVAFYEDFINKFNAYLTKTINTLIVKLKVPQSEYKNFMKGYLNGIENYLRESNNKNTKSQQLDNLISRFAKIYMSSVYEECNISIHESNKNEKALKYLEKLKESGKTPSTFEFKDQELVEKTLRAILAEVLFINSDNIMELFILNNDIKRTELSFENREKDYRNNLEKLNCRIDFFTENTKVYQCAIDNDPSQTIENLKLEIAKLEEKNLLSISNTKVDVEALKVRKSTLKKKVMDMMKNKQVKYGNPEYQQVFNGKSIFDILINELRYVQPISFEDMIQRWEQNCAKNQCNYLAIEYPSFAQPGGYQLAINAKPEFIRKALQLCNNRSVLYIDGDMNIRKHPGIFNYKDIDFMARGWLIDPRSSYKMEESIMYDPYMLETSGGTMFFSQSNESKALIELWINTAQKPINQGKADDRVLSLIYNAKSALLWTRTMQLPIEYLWLTLDYDERMMEYVYDYDNVAMQESIIIDHPECLTSEDTAAGAGASSDRQPKFYSFIEETTPCSEQVHEYLLFNKLISEFPELQNEVASFAENTLTNAENSSDKFKTESESIAQQVKEDTENLEGKIETMKGGEIQRHNYLPFFKNYYEYMDGVTYIDDGNEELEELGLIDPANPEDNEQPLYIVKYTDKYGNKKYPGEGETYNEIVEINKKKASQMNLESLYKSNDIKNYTQENMQNCVMIENISKMDDSKIVCLIYRLLTEGKKVIYNPSHEEGYNGSYLGSLVEKIKGENGMYKYCNFIFNPNITSQRKSNFYKPYIMLNQPMYFSPDSFLQDFLIMHVSLENLSVMIHKGSYEFMSLVRVGYYFGPRNKNLVTIINENNSSQKGGVAVSTSTNPNSPIQYESKVVENYINEYESIMDSPIPKTQTAGKAKRSYKKRSKSKHKKTRRRK